MAVKISGTFILLNALLTMALISPALGNISPPSGTKFYFENGSNGMIEWTYTFNQSNVAYRNWYFDNGTRQEQLLASVFLDRDVAIDNSTLPRFNARKPGTLVLQNIDENYNGMYRFEIQLKSTVRVSSTVDVIVLVRPSAVTNCSNVEVDEGDEMRCLCEGKHGNPPASVSWIKDGVTVAGPGSLQILLVKKIYRNDGGTYICKALSYDLQDQTSATLNVSYSPAQTRIVISPTTVVFGTEVTISCEADASPPATFRILHNGTIVSNVETYLIPSTSFNDSGTYECIASNRLGSSSTNVTLSLTVEEIKTSPTTESKVETNSSGTPSASTTNGGTSDGLCGAAFAGILVLTYVLQYSG